MRRDTDTPSLFDAVEKRDKVLKKLEDRSAEFNEAAKSAVLEYLREHSPSSCEDIVDAVKKRGIRPMKGDDRSFGPIFMSLSRGRKISRIGFQPRRKAHAAPGASIWRIA
jgi:hypothetical protein